MIQLFETENDSPSVEELEGARKLLDGELHRMFEENPKAKKDQELTTRLLVKEADRDPELLRAFALLVVNDVKKKASH